MNLYRVTFTVTVSEEIEAESQAEAEQIFSELGDGPELLVEMGTTTVEMIEENID